MSDPITDGVESEANRKSAAHRFNPPHAFCRAKPMGMIKEFSECLASREFFCAHRLLFGYGAYCSHPEHQLIAASTQGLIDEPKKGTSAIRERGAGN